MTTSLIKEIQEDISNNVDLALVFAKMEGRIPSHHENSFITFKNKYSRIKSERLHNKESAEKQLEKLNLNLLEFLRLISLENNREAGNNREVGDQKKQKRSFSRNRRLLKDIIEITNELVTDSNKSDTKILWKKFIELPIDNELIEIFPNEDSLKPEEVKILEDFEKTISEFILPFFESLYYGLKMRLYSNGEAGVGRILKGFNHFWTLLKAVRTESDFIQGNQELTEFFLDLVRLYKIANQEKAHDFSFQKMHNPDFSKLVLKGDDFQGTILISPIFSDTTLEKVNFGRCVMSDADFQRADIYDCSFLFSELIGANFSLSKGNIIDFQSADLRNAILEGCKWKDIDFGGSDLSEVSFVDSTLYGVKLENAKTIEMADFREASFSLILPQNDSLKSISLEELKTLLKSVKSLHKATFPKGLIRKILLEKSNGKYLNEHLFLDSTFEDDGFIEDNHDENEEARIQEESNEELLNQPKDIVFFEQKFKFEQLLSAQKQKLSSLLTFFSEEDVEDFINGFTVEWNKEVSDYLTLKHRYQHERKD